MSAQELRKAAETLRERAKAADAAPWEVTGLAGSPWDDLVVTDASNGITADCDTSNENATYIATMHPGVGLALADWLDYSARGFDAVGGPSPEHEDAFPMIRLARLINGGAS